MALQIGAVAPDFEAETTDGKIKFHDWIGNSWALLFSHPKDFTPVCTTELGALARLKPEFDKRGVKLMGLSRRSRDQPREMVRGHQGDAGRCAELSDDRRHRLQGRRSSTTCCRPPISGDAAKRTAADNLTVRNVFIIGPDKKIKLILVYPMTTGRNFQEILRVIDSLQMTAKHRSRHRPTGSRATMSSSRARSPTTRPRPSIRRAGRRRSRICGSCRSRSDGGTS